MGYETKTRVQVNVKKMDENDVFQKMDMSGMRESALSYMTKITQQQLLDYGYYFVKRYETPKSFGENTSRIYLKRNYDDELKYGKQGAYYIPFPDEFLLTESEARKGEVNPKLYQSVSFKNAATYLLYQVYYGNIIPDGYTYDETKQRVKKIEM